MSAAQEIEAKKRKRPTQEHLGKGMPKKQKKSIANGTPAGKELSDIPKPQTSTLNGTAQSPMVPQTSPSIPPQVSKKERKYVHEQRKEEEAAILRSAVKDKGNDEKSRKLSHSDERAMISRATPRPSQHWALSEPTGGSYLDLPPVFSLDEKYLLLANSRALFVYEASSSLLVRRLVANPSSRITSFALSPANNRHVLVSTNSGQISLWDWATGTKFWDWTSNRPILALAVEGSTESNDFVIYTTESRRPGKGVDKYTVNVHQITEHGRLRDSAVLLTTELRPLSFGIYLRGRTVVANCGSVISIGERSDKNDGLKDMTYVWREVTSASQFTCFDVSITSEEISMAGQKKGKAKSKETASIDRVNLAIGCESGQILVYENIVAKLKQLDQAAQIGPEHGPLLLHWHRRSVGSLRWSLDGHYIISGGQETVLCQWNVRNAKRSDLPHLVSPIKQIVVSPKGASYAIALADNSIIVLSTVDLMPTTNIAGLQSTTSELSENSRLTYDTPCSADPSKPNEIIVAVPASQALHHGSNKPPSCPYVQRYDLSAGRHISRQAITRSNATVFMDAPNSKPLDEPSCIMLQLSNDGEFLATVDEWSPPPQDLAHAVHGKTSVVEEQDVRREVHLKFWRQDHETGLWRLITRVEAPHVREDGSTPGRIFALVANPGSPGFATLGDDGYCRIWTPKKRGQDGTLVRSTSGASVFWSSRHTIELESVTGRRDTDDDIDTEQAPTFASLAFSSDGSTLAATQEFASGHCQGLVHLINVETGTVSFSRAGLYAKDLAAVGLVHRYLIVLSQTITVWDIVNDELVYSIEKELGIATQGKYLAVNSIDGTFAVSLPTGKGEGLSSKALIFETGYPEPLYTCDVGGPTTALLAAPGSRGFIVLDAAAEVRVLSPPSATGIAVYKALDAMALDANAAAPLVDEIEDEDEEMEEPEPIGVIEDEDEEMEDVGDDKPVVRPEQLAQIFDIEPSYALPPVKDLFKSVVSLYARKPHQQVVS